MKVSHFQKIIQVLLLKRKPWKIPERCSGNSTLWTVQNEKDWRNRPSDPFTWQLELFVPLNMTLCLSLLSAPLLSSVSLSLNVQAACLSSSGCRTQRELRHGDSIYSSLKSEPIMSTDVTDREESKRERRKI